MNKNENENKNMKENQKKKIKIKSTEYAFQCVSWFMYIMVVLVEMDRRPAQADPLRWSTSPISRRGPMRSRLFVREDCAGRIHGRRSWCQRRRIQSSTRATRPVATITLERKKNRFISLTVALEMQKCRNAEIQKCSKPNRNGICKRMNLAEWQGSKGPRARGIAGKRNLPKRGERQGGD